MTPKTIYWAVLLDEECVENLKSVFKPAHKNVYAEHSTLVFGPTDEQDNKWATRIGEKVKLTVLGRAIDDKGDALVVSGIERDDQGILHITLSCAEGTKPYYSNLLLAKGYSNVNPMIVSGTIARYTKNGWSYERA